MYYNFVVRIPSEKGKILTKAKGRSSYVLFQYGVYYGENVPLFRRNGHRKSGTMILRVRSRDTALK